MDVVIWMILIIAGCAIIGRSCANLSASIRDKDIAESFFRKEGKVKE